MKAFIATLLLLSASALAQQSCPIQPTHYTPFDNGSLSQLYIGWENTANQPTTGIRFGAYYFSVGEKHDLDTVMEYNGAINKNPKRFPKKHFHTWYVFDHRTQSGGVWVQKVVFADGTVWQDDGSRSCNFERNK
jgi:hypothetical protein